MFVSINIVWITLLNWELCSINVCVRLQFYWVISLQCSVSLVDFTLGSKHMRSKAFSKKVWHSACILCTLLVDWEISYILPILRQYGCHLYCKGKIKIKPNKTVGSYISIALWIILWNLLWIYRIITIEIRTMKQRKVPEFARPLPKLYT